MTLNVYNLINGMSEQAKKDAIYFNSSGQGLFHILKKFMDDNPDKNDAEVIEYMENYIKGLKNEILEYYVTESDSTRISVIKKLLNNENIIRQKYAVLIEEEKNGKEIRVPDFFPFEGNDEANMRFLISEALLILRKNLTGLFDETKTQELIEMRKKNPEEYNKKMPSTDKRRRKLDLYLDMNGKSEFEKIKMIFANYVKFEGSGIKDKLINNLQIIGRNLEKTGLLNRNYRLYCNFLEQFGLSEIKTDLDDNRSLRERVFGEDVLGELSIDELNAISMYWMNQYAKEMEAIFNTYFTIKSLNLIGALRKAKPNPKTGLINLDYNFDDVRVLIEKALICKGISKFSIAKILKSNDSDNLTEIDPDKKEAVGVNNREILQRIIDEYSDEYEKHFKSIQPNQEHILAKDYTETSAISNVVSDLYIRKDYGMIPFLYNALCSDFTSNWGIIIEDGVNIAKRRMIALGIDLDGFNMPIRLHFSKESLMKFIKENTGDVFFRLYEGNDDFIFNGRNYGTHILMPSTKAHARFLKRKSLEEADPKTRNLIEHLLFLSDKKEYPEHLKKSVETCVQREITQKNNKGKKTKKKVVSTIRRSVRPDTKYINLKTGFIYVRDKNGGYVLYEESKSHPDGQGDDEFPDL